MNRKAQVQAALSRTPSPTRQENIKFLKPGPVAPPSDPAPAEEPLGRPKLDRSDKFYHPNDQKRGHMLMTEEVAATLPPLYSTENDEDPVARVKFFSSAGTWLVTEMDPDTGQMFGWADLGQGFGGELGYISLPEMQEVTGSEGMLKGHPLVERDLYWDERPLSVARKENPPRQRNQGRRYDQAEWLEFITEGDAEITPEMEAARKAFTRAVTDLWDQVLSQAYDMEYEDADELAYLTYGSLSGAGVGLWEDRARGHERFEAEVNESAEVQEAYQALEDAIHAASPPSDDEEPEPDAERYFMDRRLDLRWDENPFAPVKKAFRSGNPPADGPDWEEIVASAQKLVDWAQAGAAAPAPAAASGGISPKMLKAELARKRGRDKKTGYEVLKASDVAAFIRFSWAADPSGKTAKFIWRKFVNLGAGERGKKHRATRLATSGVGKDGELEASALAKILSESGTVEAPPPVPAAQDVPIGSGQIVAYGAVTLPYEGGPLTGSAAGYDPCDSFTVVVTGEQLNPEYVATEEFLLKIPARAVPVRAGILSHGTIERIVPQGDSYAVVISTTEWVAMPVGMGRDLARTFTSAASCALAVADTDTATSYRFDGLEDTPAAHEWVAVFTGAQEVVPPPGGDEPTVQVGDAVLIRRESAPFLNEAFLRSVVSVTPDSFFYEDSAVDGEHREMGLRDHRWVKAGALTPPTIPIPTYAAHNNPLVHHRAVYGIHEDPSSLAPSDPRPYGQTFGSFGLPVARLDDNAYLGSWFVKSMDEEGLAFAVPAVYGKQSNRAQTEMYGALDRPFPRLGAATEQWQHINDWWVASQEASWVTLPAPPQALPGTIVRKLNADGTPTDLISRVKSVRWLPAGGYHYYVEEQTQGGNPYLTFEVYESSGGHEPHVTTFNDLADLDRYLLDGIRGVERGGSVWRIKSVTGDANDEEWEFTLRAEAIEKSVERYGTFSLLEYITRDVEEARDTTEQTWHEMLVEIYGDRLWTNIAVIEADDSGPQALEPPAPPEPVEAPAPAPESADLLAVTSGVIPFYRGGEGALSAGPAYFISTESMAGFYGPVTEYRLQLTNPKFVDLDGWGGFDATMLHFDDSPAVQLAFGGYDSAVYASDTPSGRMYTVYALDGLGVATEFVPTEAPPAPSGQLERPEVIDVALPDDIVPVFFAFPNEDLLKRGRGVPRRDAGWLTPSGVLSEFAEWPAARSADEKGPAAMSIRAARVMDTFHAGRATLNTHDWGVPEGMLAGLPTAVFTGYFGNAPAIPVIEVVLDLPMGVRSFYLAKIGNPVEGRPRNYDIIYGVGVAELEDTGWWVGETGSEASESQPVTDDTLSPKKWRKFGGVLPRGGRFIIGEAGIPHPEVPHSGTQVLGYQIIDQPYGQTFGEFATKREARDVMRNIKAIIREHGDIDLSRFPLEGEDVFMDAPRRRVDIASALGQRALRDYDRIGLPGPVVEPLGLLPVPVAPEGAPITAITGAAVGAAHALSPVAADMMAHIINCTVTIAAQDPATRAHATSLLAFKSATRDSFEAGMRYCLDAREFGDAEVTPEAEDEVMRVFADEDSLDAHVHTAQERAFALMNPEAAEVIIATAPDGPTFQEAISAAAGGVMGGILDILRGIDEEPEEEPEEAPAAAAPRRTRSRATSRAPRQRATATSAEVPPEAPPGIGAAPTAAEQQEAAEGLEAVSSMFTPEMLAMMREAMGE